MKKIIKLLLCMSLIFALTGCQSEQSATYKKVEAKDYGTLTDIQTIDATGDKVIRLKQVVEIEFSDTYSAMEKSVLYMEIEDLYKKMIGTIPEGVTMEYTRDGDIFRVTVDINFPSCDLKELVDKKLLNLEADPEKYDKLSFKAACKSYEKLGYTLQK